MTILSRYESTLERGLFKALHELQRLQAERQGDAVPLPEAVDVEVSVSRDRSIKKFADGSPESREPAQVLPKDLPQSPKAERLRSPWTRKSTILHS